MIFPKATTDDARNGWSYSYEYTYRLSEYTKQYEDNVSQEQVEYVLEAIEKMSM